jgi:general secretion pathway protein D
MRNYTLNLMRSLFLIMVVVWAQPLLPVVAQTTDPASEETSQTDAGDMQYISIDFNNVDIAVFIKFISELTGTNFVVDQRVKGKVTIISPNKISMPEAYKVFESVLEIHGFTTVEAGEITKIIPMPDARTKNIETIFEDDATGPEDKVVTQLIPLKYADVDRIRALFAPLVSKSSVMLAYPATNTLIITDVYSNITRLLRILGEIDVMGIGRELSVIPMVHADATKMEKILATVFRQTRGTSKKKAAATPDGTLFVADERTNSLIIHASEIETIRIRKLIEMLDGETPKGTGRIRVYYLKHASAEDLAKVLQEIPSDKDGEKAKGKAPILSEKVRITADKATNSLIIIAEKDDYAVLEEVINQLDIPRAMVYIESLIMEVNVDRDFQIGTEWAGFEKIGIDGQPAAAGGAWRPNENSLIGFGDEGTASFPQGFTLGIITEALNVGGITFPNLSAVATALKDDQDVHILSTPQILTTDNEEATITVGKNVAFQTRSAAETGVQTYSSFEYKDVGITLKITPQISQERMVRLTIDQEITRLDQLATVNVDRPATFKRTIQTTVMVEDNSTVVIGGLIDDQLTENERSVPCLGEIPGAGWLFKARSEASEKTNLFIFITPHVVQNAEEAVNLYQLKRQGIDSALDRRKMPRSNSEGMKSIEGGAIKLYPTPGEDTAEPQGPATPKAGVIPE